MEEEEGEPPAPGTEEDNVHRAPPAPVVSSSTKDPDCVEPSTVPSRPAKRKAPSVSSGPQQKTVTIGSNPILYSQSAIVAAPVASTPVFWGMSAGVTPVISMDTTTTVMPPTVTQTLSSKTSASNSSDPPVSRSHPTEKLKKLKKEKPAKKTKTKMPSLVKKWQSIQRELDEEENSTSSDEDRDFVNQKRIEEWKQQQLVSGKAEKNANFEALPEDWRERLKRKKLAQNT
ncbi:formin-binding protein 4-like [Polypterus senegalus]|nr:formin-binding protein 4-like [Polypterus senegalus]